MPTSSREDFVNGLLGVGPLLRGSGDFLLVDQLLTQILQRRMMLGLNCLQIFQRPPLLIEIELSHAYEGVHRTHAEGSLTDGSLTDGSPKISASCA